MVIDPWRKPDNEKMAELKPDLPVLTMRMSNDDVTDLLCEEAYTTEEERRRHFWYRRPEMKIAEIECKLSDYLRMHMAEITGMNPFYTIGRQEFMLAWIANHKTPLGE